MRNKNNPIEQYFDNYKARKYGVTLPNGEAGTVEEFYEKCLKDTMLDKQVVLAWHNMLVEYTNRDDAIFMIRRYENGSKKSGRWNTRRSSLTRFKDGFSYVFTSNFEAHEIFNMASKGIAPTVDEFAEMMNERRYRMHYDNGKSKSCEEFDISAYPNIGSVRGGVLSESDWYLAHIFGVNMEYVNENSKYEKINKKEVEIIFPRGELNDWDNSEGFSARHLQYNLNDYQKKIVKAAFLRFVDPINYFLTPSRSNYIEQSGRYNQTNIGENPDLIEFIKRKYINIFGESVYKDYLELILAKNDDDYTDSGKKTLSVRFGSGVRKDTSNNQNQSTKSDKENKEKTPQKKIDTKNNVILVEKKKQLSINDEKRALCLYDYLFRGLSFRAIEETNLGIEKKANGGGFVAQNIIRDFGIQNESKNSFKGREIEDVKEELETMLNAIDFIIHNKKS